MIFDPFSISFCMAEIEMWFQSSTCEYAVFSAPFVEEAIFSPMSVLGSFVKSQSLPAFLTTNSFPSAHRVSKGIIARLSTSLHHSHAPKPL
jgi:hypothetical protein